MDRPNPINCVDEEGPVLDLDYTSFVGLHSIRTRHAKTIGELAVQFKEERFPKCELYVLGMEGYDKKMWYDRTLMFFLVTPFCCNSTLSKSSSRLLASVASSVFSFFSSISAACSLA